MTLLLGLHMLSRFFLKAHVYFLSTEVGGRSGPAYSGYRPLLRVDDNYLTSVRMMTEAKTEMKPGHFYDVTIELPLWEGAEEYLGISLKDRLKKGIQIQLSEGSRIIAIGLIDEVMIE